MTEAIQQIKDRLDIVDLIGETVQLKKQGKEFVGLCPFHSEKTPSFNVNPEKQMFHCFGCGKGGDIFTYVEGKEGYSFQEALEYLAERAGIQISEGDARVEQTKRKELDLLEEVQMFFQECMKTDKAASARAYLKERGYTEDDILNMGLGFFPGYKETVQWLEGKGYTQENREQALNCLNTRGGHTVTFLWRDRWGRPLSLWGRLARKVTDTDQVGKYLPFSDGVYGKKSFPLNLDKAKEGELVIVEGPFDALLAQARGIPGAVALGSSHLTGEQRKAFEVIQKRQITLALDGDKGGWDGTEKAIRELQDMGFPVFVAEIPEGEDPDSVISRQGADTFREILRNAIPAARWMVNRIQGKYEMDTDKGNNAFLEEVLTYISTLSPLVREESVKDLALKSGRSESAIMAELESKRAALEYERLKQRTAESLSTLAIIAKEDPLKAIEQMERDLPLLRTRARAAKGEGLPRPYTMEDYYREIENAREGLETGFKSLDKYIAIPMGAITIIAGRPRHGKTALMLNMLLNMARKHEGKKFYFFSYEMGERALTTRLLMMASGHPFRNSEKNIWAYQDYIKGGWPGGSVESIECARRELKGLMVNGGITLIGKSYPADELADTIRAYAEQGDTGAVFVDYVQKVPAPRDYRAQAAYQKVQAALEILRETAVTTDLPLIMGAQFRRPDKPGSSDDKRGQVLRLESLRESGDIEQDANLVVGLWNERAETMDEEGKDPGIYAMTSTSFNLDLAILKNRDGIVGKNIQLSFDPRVQKIQDIEG